MLLSWAEDVGAQIVPRNSGMRLDLKHSLSRDARPLQNRLRRDFQEPAEGASAADILAGLLKGGECGFVSHALIYKHSFKRFASDT